MAKGSSEDVKKTLEPINPGILEPLFCDFAADLFEIGHVIKGGALVFGVAVSTNTEGHFSLYLSFSRMSSPFAVTGFTLYPI